MNKDQILKQQKINKPISADKFAKIALKAIHKNKVVICPMPLKKQWTYSSLYFLIFIKS